MTTKATLKAELTERRILDAALKIFREKGFEETTVRDIAAEAGVATGAAYYYFSSKDAIVAAFYQISCDEIQPILEDAIHDVRDLEARLKTLIRVKLDYFRPNRVVLRALLRSGADPKHPLSPFSTETKAIRDIDVEWFRQILIDGGVRIPRDLEPHLPEVLWLFQMGVIYFWVTDESEDQFRTSRLLEFGTRAVVTLLKISGLPLTRPLRKAALELIEIVKGS